MAVSTDQRCNHYGSPQEPFKSDLNKQRDIAQQIDLCRNKNVATRSSELLIQAGKLDAFGKRPAQPPPHFRVLAGFVP